MREKPLSEPWKKKVYADGNDYAIHIGDVRFNCTRYILEMPLEQLHALEDGDYSTDVVGDRYISHDGPFEVRVVDQILQYFKVNELTEITQAMRDEALAACPHESITRGYKWREIENRSVPSVFVVVRGGVAEVVGISGSPVNMIVADLDCEGQTMTNQQIDDWLRPIRYEPISIQKLDAKLSETRDFMIRTFGRW